MTPASLSDALWDLVEAGRPHGRPVYTRPAPATGPVLELPYPGTDPLAGAEADVAAAARHLDPLTALTAVVDGTLGVRRLEPHDLVGPHGATASIRGVRVARLTAVDAAGRTGEYDPTVHGLAPARPGFVPTALRLDADVTRVPEGYAPVREVVGLLEAGMHHATAAWLAGLLLPGWTMTAGRGDATVSGWQAAAAPRGVEWPIDPAAFARPFGELLAGRGVLDVLNRRSAGRGPLGLVPSRRPDPRGSDALPALLRAAAAGLCLTESQNAPLRLTPVSPAAVAEAFTYPAHRVDAAACDTGFLLVARRPSADARTSLLAAGACYQRLALAAGAHGYFLRPVRSVRAPELAAAAGLRAGDAILLTLLGGRSRYTELALPTGSAPPADGARRSA